MFPVIIINAAPFQKYLVKSFFFFTYTSCSNFSFQFFLNIQLRVVCLAADVATDTAALLQWLSSEVSIY